MNEESSLLAELLNEFLEAEGISPERLRTNVGETVRKSYPNIDQRQHTALVNDVLKTLNAPAKFTLKSFLKLLTSLPYPEFRLTLSVKDNQGKWRGSSVVVKTKQGIIHKPKGENDGGED